MKRLFLFLALFSVALGPAIPAHAGSFLQRYESGTFTPSINFGGAHVGQTGTFNGYYTLIGNRVFFNLEISLTAKGSSTGVASIAGLPYTNLNATNNRAAMVVRDTGTTAVTGMTAYLGPNATAIGLLDFVANAEVSLTETNFTNTTDIMISGSYPIS